MAKDNLNEAAALLGRKGGQVSSEAKTIAARENATLGGWPKGRARTVAHECKCGAILKLKFQYANKGVNIYQGVCEGCGAKNSEQVHAGKD